MHPPDGRGGHDHRAEPTQPAPRPNRHSPRRGRTDTARAAAEPTQPAPRPNRHSPRRGRTDTARAAAEPTATVLKRPEINESPPDRAARQEARMPTQPTTGGPIEIPANDPRVQAITPADVPRTVQLVYELAEYEKLPDDCHLTAAQLHAALFAPQPAVFALVARERPDSPQVGFALYFLNFSTWEGVHGIYLEDLYVTPGHRGSGLGRAMLATLAAIARQRGYARVEWSVLDWNAPSIDFYRRLGAVGMDGWTTFRLTGPALGRMAGETA